MTCCCEGDSENNLAAIEVVRKILLRKALTFLPSQWISKKRSDHLHNIANESLDANMQNGRNDPNFEFFFKRQPEYYVSPGKRNKIGIRSRTAQFAQNKNSDQHGYMAPLASLMVMTT